MTENYAPIELPMLPTVFRLESITQAFHGTDCRITARLYHARASVTVGWTARKLDARFAAGGLVSPRWKPQTVSSDGIIGISHLVVLARPEPTLNIFDTVPPCWVKQRGMVERATALWNGLIPEFQGLFNAVFWESSRFERFCVGPSSLRGHHPEVNGNLRHCIEVAEGLHRLVSVDARANPELAVIAGLLHDAGKADEYVRNEKGRWEMSDRGKLLGHKNTIVEWLAVARHILRPAISEHLYQALVHALTAAPNVPSYLGIRPPMTREAILLSQADRASGQLDLIDQCTPETGGWGDYHQHLGGRPYTARSK